MSLVQDLYAGLKWIVTIEDRIVQVADDVSVCNWKLPATGSDWPAWKASSSCSRPLLLPAVGN